jgi:hypothetical protein
VTLTIAAGIAARERYLAAIRLHEADLAASLRGGHCDYALVGLIHRLRRTIIDEARLSQKEIEA